jgi:hypothetical protein
MFNAGSAVGYFKLDNSEFVKGVNQAKTANESMTGSMVKAGIILEALKAGFMAVTGFVKDSTKAYIDSEKAAAQLNAVLKSTGGAAGISAKEVTALASKYQELTTFEDDAVLSAQNLLLTFTKISKDIFPQTTETVLDMSQALGQDLKSSAIQLGKALQDPITGITALRRVGVNFSDSQQEMIKGLVESGRLLDAQKLILKELNTEFGGSAQAARQTFGGSIMYLTNMFNDLQETIGKFVAGFGKGFVNEMANGVKAVAEFLNKAETIDTLINVASVAGGAIGAIKVAFSSILSVVSPVADMIKNSLVTGLDQLGIKLNSADMWLGMFSGAITIVSGLITLAGQAITTIIKNLFNFLSYVKETYAIFPKVGKVIADTFLGIVDVISKTITSGKALFEALKDPLNLEKWKTAGGSIVGIVDSVKTSFATVISDTDKVSAQILTSMNAGKKFVVEGVTGLVDFGKTAFAEISNFGKDSQVIYEKMMAAYKAGAIKTQEDLQAFFNSNPVDIVIKTTSEGGDNKPAMTDEQSKAYEEFYNKQKTDRQKDLDDVDENAKKYKDALKAKGEDEAKVTEWANKEKKKINDKADAEEKKAKDEQNKAMLSKVMVYIQAVLDAAKIVVDGIQSISNTAYQNELDKLQLKYDEQYAIIDDSSLKQLETATVVNDQEIADLDNKLATKQITQEQYDALAKESSTKKEAEVKRINEKAAADKNALEKKQLEEENAIKKKQFETNKALSIVNVWLNLASAIMGYVASFASLGIPGIVLMAVMSALATGVAVAQTVVISQQQFVPARAEGGDVQAGQPYKVGERGQEIFIPGVSGAILDSAMTRNIMAQNTTNQKTYAISITGNNISNQMDLDKITQHVIDEIGRQVG